jgi:hypothetical protein
MVSQLISKEMRLPGDVVAIRDAVVPSRRLYWENSDDVHNKAMSDAMSQNHFEEILCFSPV